MIRTPEISLEAETALLELVRRIAEIRRSNEEREKSSHERFNVFTALLKPNDEVRLHTRFIHCMLDPNGTHDCGPLFLNLFFETLRDDNLPLMEHNKPISDRQFPDKIGGWRVAKETRKLGNGQIDILLEGSSYGIAIENKIDHYEGDCQLGRYARSLTQRYGKSWKLIYLTKDGKESQTAAGESYLRISYEVHVLDWLERCLRATSRIGRINSVIQQYRDVVRQITRRTLNEEAMKQLHEFIRAHPEIIVHSLDIEQGVKEVISTAWNSLEDMLSHGLDEQFTVDRDKGLPLASGPGASLVLHPVAGSDAAGEFVAAPFGIWLERDEISFGIGIAPKDAANPAAELFEEIHLKLREMAGDGFHQSEVNETYPAGWHDLLNGTPEQQVAQLLKDGADKCLMVRVREYLRRLAKAYASSRAP